MVTRGIEMCVKAARNVHPAISIYQSQPRKAYTSAITMAIIPTLCMYNLQRIALFLQRAHRNRILSYEFCSDMAKKYTQAIPGLQFIAFACNFPTKIALSTVIALLHENKVPVNKMHYHMIFFYFLIIRRHLYFSYLTYRCVPAYFL